MEDRKRKLTVLTFACLIAAAASLGASPRVRIDLGAIVPRGTELSLGGYAKASTEGFLEEWPFAPLPEADIDCQWELGRLNLGIGARAFSIVVESIAWPNAYAELDLGKASIEARLGGGAFFMFGLMTRADFGRVLLPDLSAWYKIGSGGVFRLGGGVLGLYVPDAFGEAMPIVLYVGGKVSVSF